MQLADHRVSFSGNLLLLGRLDRPAEGCCYDNGVGDSGNNPFKGRLQTVFLDRDGVLNEKMPEGRWVATWDEFRVLPGVPEAIARLNDAGLRVIVVSNQRGVALGAVSMANVEAIQLRFQGLLAEQDARVDAFYVCPHDRLECNCRKPLPGMFLQAQREFPEIAIQSSVMFGDSLSDIEFGRRLGMTTVLIDGDPKRQAPGVEDARKLANLHFPSFAEAVDALLQLRGQ
jgi:D-glycero-D-manno-heptose 1,7-bisphosphate phosphatase